MSSKPAHSKDTTGESPATAPSTTTEGGLSPEQFRAVVEGIQTAVFVTDADCVVQYANRAAFALCEDAESAFKSLSPGFNPGAVIGFNIGTIIDAGSDDTVRLARLPEKFNVTGDGQIFDVFVKSGYDASGNRTNYTLTWSDVTERRRQENEAVRLHGQVEGAMTAIMQIDLDRVITYANKSSVDLLTKHEATLRTLYPSLDVRRLVGTCIDIFHKNPAHQAGILADPRNLPWTSDIQVGPLTFEINVTPIYDANGTYAGCGLEWSDVTEARAKAVEASRLSSAIEGLDTQLMLADLDGTIVYANPSVVQMLRHRESELRQVFSGFDVNNVIGANFDQFHRNPSHQRRILSDESNLPHKTKIKVGPLHFALNATAVVNDKGEHIGNALEWRDITEEQRAQGEVEALLREAVAGRVDQRLNAESYDGFMRDLGSGINSLLDATVAPLKAATPVIQGLSQGELTLQMTGEFEGLFREFQDAVNGSVQNLRNVVLQIRNSAGQISNGAGEISQGNNDLSERTSKQAAALQETASTCEELTSTVKQNADNARTADQLAKNGRELAEKGGGVVGNAISAMSEINASSKKISDIIGVIDEIAFQTNLLALNAAVEAARAGEQGRGFAVVAAEVRNLAQRSAEAAKEIKALINDSVEKVGQGTRFVDESGKTLDEIVTAVKKVSDVIAEIAAASDEQASGIDQVNAAIAQLDSVTQQNASLVEEAAAASSSMDDQASGLAQLMSRFNVGQAGGQASFGGGLAAGGGAGATQFNGAPPAAQFSAPQSATAPPSNGFGAPTNGTNGAHAPTNGSVEAQSPAAAAPTDGAYTPAAQQSADNEWSEF